MKNFLDRIKMGYRKVYAFTIVEVLITMILTVIVFSISFLSYKIVRQQLNEFSKSSDELMEYAALQNAINVDTRQAVYLAIADEGFKAFLGDSSVRYQFQDSLVIRENAAGVLDSFRIDITNSAFSFQNAPVTMEGELFDRIILSFSRNEQESIILGKKEYDAVTLINIPKVNERN